MALFPGSAVEDAVAVRGGFDLEAYRRVKARYDTGEQTGFWRPPATDSAKRVASEDGDLTFRLDDGGGDH